VGDTDAVGEEMNTTDGDAERALEILCEYAFSGYGPRTQSRCTPQEVQKAIETIRTALQSTRKPPECALHCIHEKACDAITETLKEKLADWAAEKKNLERRITERNTALAKYQVALDKEIKASSLPADTINIKREVLQGVRKLLDRTYDFTSDKFSEHFHPDLADNVKAVLASLDAVLVEGE